MNLSFARMSVLISFFCSSKLFHAYLIIIRNDTLMIQIYVLRHLKIGILVKECWEDGISTLLHERSHEEYRSVEYSQFKLMDTKPHNSLPDAILSYTNGVCLQKVVLLLHLYRGFSLLSCRVPVSFHNSNRNASFLLLEIIFRPNMQGNIS